MNLTAKRWSFCKVLPVLLCQVCHVGDLAQRTESGALIFIPSPASGVPCGTQLNCFIRMSSFSWIKGEERGFAFVKCFQRCM